jgi:hypothetical protein
MAGGRRLYPEVRSSRHQHSSQRTVGRREGMVSQGMVKPASHSHQTGWGNHSMAQRHRSSNSSTGNRARGSQLSQLSRGTPLQLRRIEQPRLHHHGQLHHQWQHR